MSGRHGYRDSEELTVAIGSGVGAMVGTNSEYSSYDDYFYTGDYATEKATIEAACAYVSTTYGGGIVALENRTWDAAITIDENDIILQGQGWDTIIDEAVDSRHVITVTGDRCVVRDLQCQTTAGGGNSYDGINSSGDDCQFIRVYVSSSDRFGMAVSGAKSIISDCWINDADTVNVYVAGATTRVSNNHLSNAGTYQVQLSSTGDNSLVDDNTMNTSGDDGVFIDTNGENCTITGNSIVSWTGEPVDDDSGTSLVADNWAGGTVLTSKGCSMATIALALTYVGASGWVEVPSGTWSEALTISNNDVILRGQGWDSIIDGAATGHAINISGSRCVVRDITVKTNTGIGNTYDGIVVGGDTASIINVRVNGSDRNGIYVGDFKCTITNCSIESCDDYGITVDASGDDSVICGNIIDTTGNDGIAIDPAGETCTIVGNRITGWTNEPIDDDSATSTVYGNNAGGPVMTSKGCSMATIALAVTYVGASGWIEVPSGTWSEAVTLGSNNITLRGQGWDSYINGAAIGTAITISGGNCIVEDIRVSTTSGGGNAYNGVTVGASDCHLRNVYVSVSDQDGVYITGGSCRLTSCKILNVDRYGVNLAGTADGAIISDNFLDTSDDDGILVDAAAEECIITDNRIINWTNEPIDDDSGTSMVWGNNAGGPVLTSKGCSMATIALAITYVGASGWIEVPSGTWNEKVALTNNTVILRGQGYDTIIDETSDSDHAITISGDDVVVRDLKVATSAAGGNAYDAINVTSNNVKIINVRVNSSDQHGIAVTGSAIEIRSCRIHDCDNNGLDINGPQAMIFGNILTTNDAYGIDINASGDESIINGNLIDATGDDGIYIDTNAEDCIIDSNRITSWTNEAIDDDSGTSTTGDNETT